MKKLMFQHFKLPLPQIPDGAGYDINMFNIPVKYATFIKSILIPNGLIKDRLLDI